MADTQTREAPPARTRERHAGDDGRSLTDLVRELRDESSQLIRQEVQLAKTELSEIVAKLARNGGYLVAGAAIVVTGVTFFALTALVAIYLGLVAAGLSNATAGWLAPLIAGVVIVLVGWALLQKGLSTLKHASLVPDKTVESLKRDGKMVKEKVKR